MTGEDIDGSPCPPDGHWGISSQPVTVPIGLINCLHQNNSPTGSLDLQPHRGVLVPRHCCPSFWRTYPVTVQVTEAADAPHTVTAPPSGRGL